MRESHLLPRTWIPTAPGVYLGRQDGSRPHTAAEGRPRKGVTKDERAVLVVEDETDARDSMVELLESEGLSAVGAENGEQALVQLRSGRRFALILLDLAMPVMDGWDFCAALESDDRLADIPVAIVTANANHDSLPRRRNNAGLFVKPVNFDRLLRIVHSICD